MNLPIQPPFPPMEALSVDRIPTGDQWQYEPKWDGFRCLAFRDEDEVQLQSKAGQPLARYFPELVEAVKALKPRKFVLDSEIAIPVGQKLSFEDLQLRLHPAESRVRKLAAQTPAIMIVFDLLVDEKGRSLIEEPLANRRAKLQAFASKHFNEEGSIFLSPATTELKIATKWFSNPGESLDGIIAKLRNVPYQSGERTGMQKIKQIRSVECVVGGFRYGTNSKLVGSLLLGLYDEAGLLHHVGFCSAIKASEKVELTKRLESLRKAPGFTGRSPGGPSRWSTERSGQWEPLDPKLVVEVSYDHFTGGRFRHGTKFIRWRPDKSPRQCGMDQVDQGGGRALRLLREAA
ncbi:MAG TPA: ATP-dependent DNA ligase [Chthoniobacteraceae bacterium]|nr:ATP-dependent DNA ligase [Chthoniobacteraceae bacterium]